MDEASIDYQKWTEKELWKSFYENFVKKYEDTRSNQGDRSNRESLRMRLYVEVYIRSTNLSQKLPDVEAKSAVENFDKQFPVNELPQGS